MNLVSRQITGTGCKRVLHVTPVQAALNLGATGTVGFGISIADIIR